MWRSVTWIQFERTVKLALGAALVWHQAAIATELNVYAFTGGLTLLGATEAFRWDLARRAQQASPPSGPPPNSSLPPSPSSEPVAP